MATQSKHDLRGTQTIAKLFGVTVRRIQQLTEDGVLTAQGSPRKYDLVPTIQAYIRYLSDKAYGREQKEAISDLNEAKLDAETRLKSAKAEIEELKLKELQGELHRAEDVEAIVTAHVMQVRALLMGLPGKLAIDCAALVTAPEVAVRINTEVRDLLEQLAAFAYDPAEYQQLVLARHGLDDLELEDDDDSGDE